MGNSTLLEGGHNHKEAFTQEDMEGIHSLYSSECELESICQAYKSTPDEIIAIVESFQRTKEAEQAQIDFLMPEFLQEILISCRKGKNFNEVCNSFTLTPFQVYKVISRVSGLCIQHVILSISLASQGNTIRQISQRFGFPKESLETFLQVIEINLIITTMTGEIFRVSIENDAPITELLKAIGRHQGKFKEFQRLVFKGTQLEEELTLAHYNLQEGDQIYLLRNLELD